MSNLSTYGLRAVIGLAAAFAVLSGLDQALGGIHTLGWLSQTAFFDVTDPQAFLVADNHQRFLGGVWTALGLALFVTLRDLKAHQAMAKLIFAMVFAGGLSRFSQMNLAVMLQPDVLWAVLVEIVGMPLLYVWLSRATSATE